MADINGEFGGFEIQEKKRAKMYYYRILESELEQIKKGSPSSIFFSIGSSCLSAFFSTLICLILTPPPSNKTWVVGVMVAMILVLLISGVVLLALWWYHRKSINGIINMIKGERKVDAQDESYLDDEDFE